MEQRRLRLGDILDDYCPRERRVTNHAVVAMIEEDVRQTRCTTCEAEHVYKGGKAPRRRTKKDSPEGLFREVLAGMPEGEAAGVSDASVAAAAALRDDERSVDEMMAAAELSVAPAALAVAEPIEEEPAAAVAAIDEEPADDAAAPIVDDGFFHRRLIRAQLPRIEGQKDVRQEPEFTIRSNNGGRGGAGASRGMRGPGPSNGPSRGGQPNSNAGNRPYGRRFAGGDPGMGGGRGRGPAGSRGGGGRPGPGGSSTGQGRGPANGTGRPRKRSR